MHVSFYVDQDVAARIFRAAYARSQPNVTQHILVALVWFLIAAAAFWHLVGFRTTPASLGSSVVIGLFFAVFGYFFSLSEPNARGTNTAKQLFKSTRPFEASFCLTEEALVIEDNLMTIHLPWHAVSGVHREEDWLIFEYGPGSCYLVPTSAFPSQVELDAFATRAVALHTQGLRSPHGTEPPGGVA